MPASRAFKEHPLAFYEEDEAERKRLTRLKEEDPIALQDAVNTSVALVEAAKEGDMEELKRVVADAEDGEFLQVFVLQAFVIALKGASLDLVRTMVEWGIPLEHPQLSQAMHLMCEVTTKDNFSNAWRIMQLLVDGNILGKMDIDMPRAFDGFTPLCVACVDACLPLAFKLLEMNADPNVITRNNETPLSLVWMKKDEDNEEQQEARDIIANMLRHYGAKEKWQDALRNQRTRKPLRFQPPSRREEDKTTIHTNKVSSTHTRFSA